MYGSYEYRRNYAHAIKDVNLAAAQPLKQALANRSLGHMAGSHPRVQGFDSRPDLDPFEMSQSFAYDMVKERMLKHAKVLANEKKVASVPLESVRRSSSSSYSCSIICKSDICRGTNRPS